MMHSLIKAASLGVTLFTSTILVASETPTEFEFTSGSDFVSSPSGNNQDNNAFGNEFKVSVNGLTAYLTAWADTGNNGEVESSEIDYNSGGLLSYNRDNRDGHAIDNKRQRDMILFRFDQAVTLTDLKLGWAPKDSDVVVAGFQNLPTLGGANTWADIGAIAKSAGNFVTQLLNIGVGNYASIDAGSFESKYWLVGAFNKFLGTGGYEGWEDKIKLSGLKTVHSEEFGSSEVNAPATFVLLTIGFILASTRRLRFK